ncbi:hypothetical protein PFISCL1PPCAC_14633 [Pristionchus fissidentatus]|uniref:receptor protein serine/threonine kinase n=1 Tax=Pristionchus fissidentatus TaxID=1538716 RepID=A0AAV5VV05_9BILA|nr:hypothetical protein PFISCL1PPCAC_14633 [Pristionchus fissidentatus]
MGIFPLLLLLFAHSSLSIRISSDLQPIPFSNDIDDDGGLSIPDEVLGRPKHPPLPLQGGSEAHPSNNECFCSYGVEDGICLENETCIKDNGAACFHEMEEVFNEDTNEMETLHKYGCTTLEKGSGASHFICHSNLIAFSSPKSIACCYEGGLCNLNITPPAYGHIKEFEYEGGGPVTSRSFSPLIVICIVLSIALLSIPAIVLWRIKKRSDLKKKSMMMAEDCGEEECMIDSSGSGSRGSAMNQRTVAQDLQMLDVIGRGRYGQVRKAAYRGSYVAVKTFYTTDEDSWQNEREIYHSEMFTHKNVLQFVAADICSVESITQMLLITDYHVFGSLSEYLQKKETTGITSEEAVELAFSVVCGLEHVHSSVHGTGGKKKPQIAHRDLKSRNIIVKRPGVCCIADFGLAVRFGPPMIPENPKVQVGTKRWMAPEVLDNSLNPAIFNNFLMADMYSLALVLWEILTRVQLSPHAESPLPSNENEHSVSSGLGESISSSKEGSTGYKMLWPDSSSRSPFDGMVTDDASFDDMIRVVCDGKKRPPILKEWTASKTTGLSSLTQITTDCWSHRPQTRPSSLRVKLDLRNVMDKLAASKAQKPLQRLKDDRKDSGCVSQTNAVSTLPSTNQ